MAYFDSPKNRALWEVELKRLREEKERRSQNKGGDLASLKEERLKREQNGLYRVRTSYRELLEEQTKERQERQGTRGRKKELGKESPLQRKEPSFDELSMAVKGKTL